MKRMIKIFLIVIFAVVSLYADAVILEFSGEPSHNKIVLRWKTSEENNVEIFFIQRSTNNRDFSEIGELTAKGNNSEYEYVDDNLIGLGVKSIYYYRLSVRNSDGSFQITESITVIPQISSFAKTWGSIKALFQ